MPLPLAIPIALGAAGLASSIYGATRKNPGVQAAPAQQTYWGGSAGTQADTQARLLAQDQAALGMADQNAIQGNQARGMQLDAYGRWQQMADGQGPSVARQMAREGGDAAARAAQAQAASARGGGGNQLAAQRFAMQTGAEAQTRANQQAATLGQQEQLAAMGQLGQMAGDIRGGDAQARAMSEARAGDRSGSYMGMGGQILQADTQRALADQEALMMSRQQNSALKEKSKDRWMQLGGALMNNAGGMAAKGGA